MVSPRRTLLNHWALLTRTCSLRSQRLRVVFLSLFHRERILWLILFIKKIQMYILHEGEISFPLVSLCRKGSSWWIEAGGGGVCYFTLLPDQSWTVPWDTHQLTESSFLILCSGAVSKGQKLAGFWQRFKCCWQQWRNDYRCSQRSPKGGSTGGNWDLKSVKKRGRGNKCLRMFGVQ